MEDEKIIELYFARREEAIRATEEKYGKLCRTLCYRLLGSWDDAEECVSDACLALWNTVPPKRPEKLSSYLCRVARNLALKKREHESAAKRRREFDVALSELGDTLAAPGGVEEQVEAAETARRIEVFLDTLTAENRVIFLRRYWFAESCAEIGERVGLTPNHVSVRLSRLRKA